MKRILILVALLVLAGVLPVSAYDPAIPQYISPKPNAQYVSTGATIILRYGPPLSAGNISDLKFMVKGSQSGAHQGRTILADDQKTVVFKPDHPFISGENVKVDVNSLRLGPSTTFNPVSYSFTVSVKQSSGSPAATPPPPPDKSPASAFPNYLTLPKDIPHYTVSKASPDSGEGSIFVSPFYWMKSTIGSYLLILDPQGEIVYYRSVANEYSAFDFKVQPNGLISYYSFKDNAFYLMNSNYQIVDKFVAGNGYPTDLHDLQLLPNGNALLMVYDAESVDMSKLVKDGKKDATVTGLVIQELDPSKNVIFEWRSWDYFPLVDAPVDLTGQMIDAVHGNSLQLMSDGNLLLSSRTLSELTKINVKTGNVMWRLGGNKNMFTFIGEAQPFAFQHDARQLPNGNIMVFDNHGNADINAPAPSRSVEYQIDEGKKTATKVWEFDHNPPVFATYMGNGQRMANGNTFLDWGAPFPQQGYSFTTITEVTPNHEKVFELAFDQPYVSYRAFRYPWQGSPQTLPDLAYRVDSNGLMLGYSWNGATEVASYQVYGGSSTASLAPVDEKAKSGFETQSRFTQLAKNVCYFQVAARDKNNQEMSRSKVISTDQGLCPLAP